MKVYIVACLLIATAIAYPQGPANAKQNTVASGPGSAAKSLVYGPGAGNNPYALPPNPIVLNRAITLAKQRPGLLVRLDVDGEVELTDRFGQEVEGVYDRYGFDMTELYDL